MNLEKLFMFGMRQQEPPPIDWTHVLLFKNNMSDVETTKELTTSLRGKRLKAVDCEGGNTVNVPSLHPLNAPRDQYHPDNVAFTIGKHLNYLGINTNLAPVTDLNSTERSFGTNPWEVGEKVRSVVMSYRATNIISCAKHFPGLPSVGDSHHDKVSITTPQLVPFFQAIRVGVPMIMMGHAFCKNIDPTTPASKSPKVYDLLRHGMAYRGVIITDSLDMKGCGGVDSLLSSTLDAFTAGADIMTISNVASADEQEYVFREFEVLVNNSRYLTEAATASIKRVDRLLNRI